MKLFVVLSSLLLVSSQSLASEQPERRSGPRVHDVVFGHLQCRATLVGPNDGNLRASLGVQGTIGGSVSERWHLASSAFPDNPIQACDDAVVRVKAEAESAGCVTGPSEPSRNVFGVESSGFQFTCVGSRAQVVAAIGAMGEELLRFLSSLEGDR